MSKIKKPRIPMIPLAVFASIHASERNVALKGRRTTEYKRNPRITLNIARAQPARKMAPTVSQGAVGRSCLMDK